MEVEKFKSIFEGLDVAYGQHQPQGSRADGKQQGKSYIVRQEVTHELWKAHLEGIGPSLGIIPIRADNTTKWGCIDIDHYPLDHNSLLKKIRELQLPLVHCKSKSGGAHLFLFLKNPIASKLVKTKFTIFLNGKWKIQYYLLICLITYFIDFMLFVTGIKDHKKQNWILRI